MNLQRFPLLLAACACLAAAQPQTAATAPPPPGVEEALRERVRPFYQAYVDEKFRKAYEVVADDSRDAFLIATKPHYDGFEIRKIVFSDDYTKAAVTTEIHTTLVFYGRTAPEKTTLESSWELVDGQWYWYVPAGGPDSTASTPAQRLLMNMFHITPHGDGSAPAPVAAPPGTPAVVPPGTPPGMPSGMPSGLPPGFPQGGMTSPAAVAGLLQSIRTQVRLDKDKVELRADQPGTAVVMVKNGMKGPVRIAVSGAQAPGLTVTSDKTEIGADASAAITIAWKPVGPHAAPPPATSFGVSVTPTGAFLPFTVTFVREPVAPAGR
ncbi:MAG: hypothetical protein ABSF98_26760 [Bryobacteraceae bacterium]|jgi:hypothetical protein